MPKMKTHRGAAKRFTRSAGESPVRDHRYGGVKPHAHQHCRGDGELAHPRASLGSFIAHDEHRSGFDGVVQ